MCSALCVSTAGFYRWRRGVLSRRHRHEQRLVGEIRNSFEASQRTYGSPRVRKDLQALGYRCSKKTIARIMRDKGLVAVQRRRFKRTTQSAHSYPITPNLLERDFTVTARDRAWVADITYIRTEEGWLYLAALMDLYSRRIVGWNTAERIDRHLTLTALEEALRHRRPKPGLVHHSDQGSQYASYEYQQRLAEAKAVSSMSRKGDCWDNAPMESFFSTLKRERVHRRRYWSRQEASTDVGDYIEVFYNRKRRHSQIGDISPVQFELAPIHT
jgi:putative transposase